MADQNINNMTVVWNSGGTTFSAVKMNVTDTASAVGSLLLQFQVGGTDKFSVRKDGKITSAGDLSVGGNATISGTLTVTGGIVGSMTGPGASTDNAIARFNGTAGTTLKNSGVTIDNSNNLAGVVNITATGTITANQNLQSSTATAVLGSTGAGNVYLRPNGVGSTTGQLQVASTGAVTVNGTLTATGDITYSSDERLKTDLLPIDRAAAVELVRKVNPISFTRKADGSRSMGFVAQDLQRQQPLLVHEDGEGYLSVAPGGLIAVLWEAVKDLQERVAA
jgi:hypothetical protein